MIDCGTYRFDRCDRCGAAAHQKAVKGDAELLLCQHHYNAFKGGLDAQGWRVAEMVLA